MLVCIGCPWHSSDDSFSLKTNAKLFLNSDAFCLSINASWTHKNFECTINNLSRTALCDISVCNLTTDGLLWQKLHTIQVAIKSFPPRKLLLCTRVLWADGMIVSRHN